MDQLTAQDPRRIGPFEVLGRLGAGGMGLVYLARSTSGRRVAIKTVRGELAEDELFRVRFAREIEAAKTVGGFYTAAVVDADAEARVPWLATAYVPAPSLEDLVGECGPLPVDAVRWLIAGIAEALQSIHAAGLVHRDLKPSNVLVVEDGPRVIDFGIAAGVSHTRLTMTNVAVGTPAYMSPEQAKDSRSVTGASDVFSLGSLLVFCATGHAPYHGGNPVETVFKLLREQADLSGLPVELVDLVRACMRPAPEHRPTPAQIQAELAPHLFSRDDAGEEGGDWLPPNALELIERKRGRRNLPGPRATAPAQPSVPAVPPVPPAVPPVPVGPPPVPAPYLAGRQSGPAGPEGHWGPPPVDPRTGALGPLGQAAVAQAAGRSAVGQPAGTAGAEVEAATAKLGAGRRHRREPAQEIQLPGASVRIGPGPQVHAAEQERPATGPTPAGTEWVRRSGGIAVPVAAPAGQAAPAEQQGQGRWRPWRFRMSNDVWGTPVVADGTLFISSFEVHALDIASGRRRYKTRDVAWAVAVDAGRLHAADGPHLYTVDVADGTERWRTSLDGWVYSLDAADGVLCCGLRGGGVQVRSTANGAELWRAEDAQQDYENPQSGPALLAGSVYYYGGGRLRCVDARGGLPRWTFPVGEDVPSRPAVRGGLVYVTAGTSVYALDAASGAQRWRFEAPVVLFTPPTLDDSATPAVYVADYLGTLYALDGASGRVRWQGRTASRQGAEPVVLAGRSALIASGDTLFAFDTTSGQEQWRYAARGEIVGAPAAADGLVHLGSRDHSLHTLELASGRLRWELGTKGELTGSPVAVGGRVFVSSKDRCVYALDAVFGTAVPEQR
ncbi:outer membrane protein assembly factor BamB/tRNA A-37 threonylcarbamoyl transferase component Bud32 [Kitasatospora sp. GAS204A]|uniref:outer membrane protein assembly factor BamB family protein n=1 Tax=unclassified Kitasatospora TaxID=2633591 RepID=UPI00247359FD|nr:PQQ-binding-like beta-propeller repeat protein [Kitasatospora sp. GAS204B]MDH6121284.1 outer membrane protein assembly factor BamB/tRNA A-37 threonylcarbamoyl transferase component Bud32 [Kitasatospora sp. GAS204B]